MSVSLQGSTLHQILYMTDRIDAVKSLFGQYSVMGKLSMDYLDRSLYVAQRRQWCGKVAFV